MRIDVIKRGIPKELYKPGGFKEKDIKITYCGYLEVEKPFEQDLWHLCNWTCWSKKRPKECRHLLIGHCNSDVAFKIGRKWYSHKMHGFPTYEKCEKEMCKAKGRRGHFSALWTLTEGYRHENEEKLIYVTKENINKITE